MSTIFNPHWKDAEWDSERWPNFTPKEVAQRSPGADSWEKGRTPVIIVPDFIDKVQRLRAFVGKPLVINSWYRSSVYNEKISSTGKNGPHTTGRAIDIQCYGGLAQRVVRCAYATGFTGIGIKQHGDYSERFIHLDDLQDNETEGPRPWIWSYNA